MSIAKRTINQRFGRFWDAMCDVKSGLFFFSVSSEIVFFFGCCVMAFLLYLSFGSFHAYWNSSYFFYAALFINYICRHDVCMCIQVVYYCCSQFDMPNNNNCSLK